MSLTAFDNKASSAFSIGKMVVAVALSGGFLIVAALPARAVETGVVLNGIDTDADDLTDIQETGQYMTDPSNPDTDGDGFMDGLEVRNGYSPRFGEGRRMIDVDSDQDFLNDAWEIAVGTDPLNPDSDNDLYLDGTEIAASYDPKDPKPVIREKRIEVDLASQRLSYYFGGVLFDSFLISSGVRSTPSPRGEFSVLDKVPVKRYGGQGFGFDYPNTKWNLHFTTGRWRYYIHGAYWHDNFGRPMSRGCINVAYKDMERLYQWAQHGTKVVIK